MRTQSGLGVAVLCACALLAACGGGSDGASADESGTSTSTPVDPPTSASSTTEATTSTTIDDEEAALLAAVDGYWSAILVAGDPSDPDHPSLREYATGPALLQAVDVLAERRQLGQIVRLPPDSKYEHRPQVEARTDTTATVVDCAIDDAELVDVESDVVLDGSTVTNLWTVELEQQQGSWRVVALRIDDSWDGATECPH